MYTSPLNKTTPAASRAAELGEKNGRTLPAVPVQRNKPVQKMEVEEEEPLQGKLVMQQQAIAPLQGEVANQLKSTEEELPLQGKFTVQKKELEEELPLQGKFTSAETAQEQQSTVQRFTPETSSLQTKVNDTGLPDNLKEGVENLSGLAMDDVKVHYNSDKPAQLNALAYAQGTDIHVGPGQETHLPHEAWHVVQQKQGRVQPTMQMKGNAVNDDKAMEREADVMGERMIEKKAFNLGIKKTNNLLQYKIIYDNIKPNIQKKSVIQFTIDQDARRWAMDWLATWTRPFPTFVRKFQLDKLYSLCVGVMGEEQPDPNAAPVLPATLRVNRAQNTTALATGLVQMGEEKAGKLSSRLHDQKEGLFDLMSELNTLIPETLPPLKTENPTTQAAFAALNLNDPFLKHKVGGAEFTFSKQMAMHMLRRHHPKYLQGEPMLVQSFFKEATTIEEIKAIVIGTIINSEDQIKNWRAFRMKKGTDINSNEAQTLNLRPFWDGMYWELTLSINSRNPSESKGVVAHFTPTL